jgi:2-methylcitrate dehydratase PrpD
VVTASFDKLPSNVVAKAKMCILDILGGALAANDTKSANCVRRV